MLERTSCHIFLRKDQNSTESECLFWGTRIGLSSSFVLEELHARNNEKGFTGAKVWWPGKEKLKC